MTQGYTIIKDEPKLAMANGEDGRAYFPALHGAALYRPQRAPPISSAAAAQPVCVDRAYRNRSTSFSRAVAAGI